MKYAYSLYTGLVLIATTGCSFNRPDDLGTQIGVVTEILPVNGSQT
jgi:hypothetical protein